MVMATVRRRAQKPRRGAPRAAMLVLTIILAASSPRSKPSSLEWSCDCSLAAATAGCFSLCKGSSDLGLMVSPPGIFDFHHCLYSGLLPFFQEAEFLYVYTVFLKCLPGSLHDRVSDDVLSRFGFDGFAVARVCVCAWCLLVFCFAMG